MLDSCGQVGSAYTNAIVPVPMGGLSTVSLNLSIGATFQNNYFQRVVSSYTKKVRLEDLACPTWGLQSQTKNQATQTVGYPFLPIIHPPSELLSFDPGWARCNTFITGEQQGGDLAFEIFDPPYALHRVPAIATPIAPARNPVDTITAHDPTPTSRSVTANPGDMRSPVLPSITKNPQLPNPGHPSTNDEGRTPIDGPINPDLEKSNSASPMDPSGMNHDAADPAGSIPNIIESDSQQANSGIGAIIFSTFDGYQNPKVLPQNRIMSTIVLPTMDSSPLVLVVDGSAFAADPSAIGMGAGTSIRQVPTENMIGANHNPPPTPIITAAGQAITVSDPAAIAIAGSTLSVGGDPVTVAGTILSLAQNGNLIMNFDNVLAGKVDNTAAPPAPGGADKTNDINSKDIVVADMSLRPGGSAATIADTIMSMAESGEIFVGDGGPPQLNQPTPIYTVAGQVFTSAPLAIEIDGKTLYPGSAITTSGTAISLAPSGKLIVGTNTVALSQPAGELAQVLTVDGHVITVHSPGLSVDGTAVSPPQLNQPTPIYTVAGHVFTSAPLAIEIDGKTLYPGSAITTSGTAISLAPSGKLIVGTNTVALSQPAGELAQVLTVDGHVITVHSPGLSVDGTAVSPPQLNQPTPIYTVAGHVFTSAPLAIEIDGKTLYPGSAITTSGTAISLAPSGELIVGTNTVALSHSPGELAQVLTVDGHVLTAHSPALSVDGTVLKPGRNGIPLGSDGTPISLDSYNNLIVGTSTVNIFKSPYISIIPNIKTQVIASSKPSLFLSIPDELNESSDGAEIFATTISGTPTILRGTSGQHPRLGSSATTPVATSRMNGSSNKDSGHTGKSSPSHGAAHDRLRPWPALRIMGVGIISGILTGFFA